MRTYLNTLIVTVIVSHLSVKFAPGKESAKKYIRFICALVVTLCLIEPLSYIIKNGREFIESIKNFSVNIEETAEENDRYASSAATIMTYVSDKYRISDEDISITFITDKADENLREIHMFIKKCEPSIQDAVERELSKELSVPVYVFVG